MGIKTVADTTDETLALLEEYYTYEQRKAFTPVNSVVKRKAFTPVGQQNEGFSAANFMGKGFTYLPESKRADLYGYTPKKDAELGADDNVLGNVPFLMAYGNKTTNKENAPYHGTFPAH